MTPTRPYLRKTNLLLSVWLKIMFLPAIWSAIGVIGWGWPMLHGIVARPEALRDPAFLSMLGFVVYGFTSLLVYAHMWFARSIDELMKLFNITLAALFGFFFVLAIASFSIWPLLGGGIYVAASYVTKEVVFRRLFA